MRYLSKDKKKELFLENFKIDLVDKNIKYVGKFRKDGTSKIKLPAVDFYSVIQDLYDEPSMMQYSVPLSAGCLVSTIYLINGYDMDEKSASAVNWVVNHDPEKITISHELYQRINRR